VGQLNCFFFYKNAYKCNIIYYYNKSCIAYLATSAQSDDKGILGARLPNCFSGQERIHMLYMLIPGATDDLRLPKYRMFYPRGVLSYTLTSELKMRGFVLHSATSAWTWAYQGSLIDWCFNGTSTQKGQFVPTAGEGNRLSRLRMANEIQCIIPYVTR